MRVPLSWLRDYVDLPTDVQTIAATLASLGFPVERIEPRPAISGVVVGKIAALAKHPNADKLQLCTIDIGAPSTLTIATAATNVAAEQIVPVARIGAQLPQLQIGPRKMRGIDSQGMLCSADELGLPPEWFEDGILSLDADAALGADVVALYGLHLPVLDVEVGANRGDALSMVGLARELGAALGTPLRVPPLLPPPAAPAQLEPGDARVTLETLDARRYVAQRVSNLTVRPAPIAMRIRLALAGQRPISNLVDISNFVMLELGQPLHFFDAEKIAGRHIIVRDARPGERITTLDGAERELDPTALVIADDAGPTGLAGLMGGSVSEVSPATREIVIESANFSGPRVRRMSLKLGLRTEASTRNEKGLPAAATDTAAARAAYLLAQDGATVHPPRAYGKPPAAPTDIALTLDDVARLLGFAVDAAEFTRGLTALGFTVNEAGGRFVVTVPSWRTDVAIAADIVEEVARIVGYDRVRAELPSIAPQALDSAEFEREMAVAHALVALGYQECLTLALQPQAVADRWRALGLEVPPAVEIRNPLSEDQRWMRFSLLPALLEHAARERAVRPLRTFEIGHVFAAAEPQPRETNLATILAVGRGTPDEPAWHDAAFLELSSDVRALMRTITGLPARLERATCAGLHPGKTARIVCGERAVGFIGTLDPRLLRAEELADHAVAAIVEIDALPARVVPHYVAISRFPAIERDLAVVVEPTVAAADIASTIRGATPLARDVVVFDEYRGAQIGADHKSLAVRIVLQRDDATLTDADADAAIARIVDALRDAHGARLRA